jgi:hypothetical protein
MGRRKKNIYEKLIAVSSRVDPSIARELERYRTNEGVSRSAAIAYLIDLGLALYRQEHAGPKRVG